MKWLMTVVAVLALVAPAQAQLAVPNEAGITYGHVHLNVSDIEVHKKLWVEWFGGEVVEKGPLTAVRLPNFLIALTEREPTGPSVGSGVDHIGFSFPNLAAKMASFEAAGIRILEPMREIEGLFKLAFIEDPWGTKIEVVEDTEWLGFHHLHLRSNDPAAALDWYEHIFAGERDSLKGRIAGLRYGTVWLLISQHDGELAPTEGRAFDHLGWQYPDLRAAAEEIKAKGVEFTMEPRPFTNPLGEDMLISFVVGPDGVRIEIVQPQV